MEENKMSKQIVPLDVDYSSKKGQCQDFCVNII